MDKLPVSVILNELTEEEWKQVQQLKNKTEDYFLELRKLVESVNATPTKDNVEKAKENLEQTQ
jgi:hypothetical protein